MVTTRGQASKSEPRSPGPGESHDSSSSDSEDIPATSSNANRNRRKDAATLRPPRGDHVPNQSPAKRKHQDVANNVRATKRQKQETAMGIIDAAVTPRRMEIPIPTGRVFAERQTNRNHQPLRRGRSAGQSAPEQDHANGVREQRLSSVQESPSVEVQDRGYPKLEELIQYIKSPAGRRRNAYGAPTEEQFDEEETDQVRQQLEHVHEKDPSPTAQRAKETQFHTAQASPDLSSGVDIADSYNEVETNNQRSSGETGGFAPQPDFFLPASMDTSQPPRGSFGPDGWRDARGKLPNGLPSASSLGALSGAPPSGQGYAPVMSSLRLESSGELDVNEQLVEETTRRTRGGSASSLLFVRQHTEEPASEGEEEVFAQSDGDYSSRQQEQPQEEDKEEEEAETVEDDGQAGGQQRQQAEEDAAYSPDSSSSLGSLFAESPPPPRREERGNQRRTNSTSGTNDARPPKPSIDTVARENATTHPPKESEPVQYISSPPLRSSPTHRRQNSTHVDRPSTNCTSEADSEDQLGNLFDDDIEDDLPRAGSAGNTTTNTRHSRTHGTNGVHHQLSDFFDDDLDDDLPRARPARNTTTSTRRSRTQAAGQVPSSAASRGRRSHARSTTARESSRTVPRASTVSRAPTAAARSTWGSSLVIFRTPDNKDDAVVVGSLPSSLVTKMHKLMGGPGWTELTETWSVDLFDPDPFDDNSPDANAVTPAITPLGDALFLELTTLINTFEGAPTAPEPDFVKTSQWIVKMNQWVGEHEESLDVCMSEVRELVQQICEDDLAILGDAVRPSREELKDRKNLTRDLVLCIVPAMVHTLWRASALGGVKEIVNDEMSPGRPRDVLKSAKACRFTDVGLQYLVRITGWLVRLEGVLSSELNKRPFYKDVIDGMSPARRRGYPKLCRKKRERLGELLGKWNSELDEAVEDMKRRETVERKRIISIKGQAAAIEAARKAKEKAQREEKEMKRKQREAFVRSTQEARRKLEEERRALYGLPPKDAEDEDEEFVSATEGGEHQQDTDDSDPFATPEPRPQSQRALQPRRQQDEEDTPASPPVPRRQPEQAPPPPPPTVPWYTVWPDDWPVEYRNLLLKEIRREPGQRLAIKRDYEGVAETLDKSLEDVMRAAATLREKVRQLCKARGTPVERWAEEI